MKIGEARAIYSAQLQKYREEKTSLAKQKKQLEEKAKIIPDGKEQFAQEAATLELSYNAVSEKYEEYHNFMEQINTLHTALFNAESSKQQGEAMAEYTQDIVKIMEVARRIAKGAKVPYADEQKLMEYNMELYMSAKNLAMINMQKKKEEYESLWDEEKDKEENPDPHEVADSAELSLNAPEIVDVADVMAATSGGEE
ncbi:MAG: hypothetical protein K2N51_03595 [Lachnospiraceae bacterium]|nr:hypothetical protein [Lachnospiraceae bacterium]